MNTGTSATTDGITRGNRRPLRIPDRIRIAYAEPPTAIAAREGAWILPFYLADNVSDATPLALQIFGGRNNPGRFSLPSDEQLARRAVSAMTDTGTNLALLGLRKGIVLFETPAGGLSAGANVNVKLGTDTDGLRVKPQFLDVENKFFVLFRLPVSSPNNSSVEELLDRATQLSSAWDPSTWPSIVGACLIDIVGGPLRRLKAYAQSQPEHDGTVRVLVRPDDGNFNVADTMPGDISIELNGADLPAEIERLPGTCCVNLKLSQLPAGAHRLTVKDKDTGLEAVTNPVVAGSAIRDNMRVYWGMIHGHTEMSDGTGSLAHYFHQIRYEAALDFAATGDHDHGTEVFGDLWKLTREAVKRHHEPGRFVVFLGYEWAKWRRNGDGDRNVYYLDDDRPMYSSDDDAYPRPADLFDAISNERAIVIPHHTGHAGNWCDWKDHDPVHERLVELFQVRGAYEGSDNDPAPERWTEPAKPEGNVCRALDMGWRVGFTAGGDDHEGHAGAELRNTRSKYMHGLMSVIAAERTREAIWNAMWNRRVTATTGPRIILHYTLNDSWMGSELNAAEDPSLNVARRLNIEFHAAARPASVDIMRNGKTLYSFADPGMDAMLQWEDTEPLDNVLMPPAKWHDRPFAYYYVRLVQSDKEVAWASPTWIDPAS